MWLVQPTQLAHPEFLNHQLVTIGFNKKVIGNDQKAEICYQRVERESVQENFEIAEDYCKKHWR